MSITFWAPGAGDDLPEMNMANRNAMDFLEWCGLPKTYGGSVNVVVLKAKLALLIAAGVGDEGLPSQRVGNVIDCGREPGYMVEKAKLLFEIADAAHVKQGDKTVISWG